MTNHNENLKSGKKLFIPSAGKAHEISTALAHVRNEKNLFVRKVWETGKTDEYCTELCADGTHPYLYENPAIANHVSGTTVIDATRQTLKAISHLYYNVPLDSRFILQSFQLDFMRWMKLNVLVYILVSVETTPPKRPGGRQKFNLKGTYIQENRVVGKFQSIFTSLSKELEEKLMSSQYSEKPEAVIIDPED